MVRGIPRFYFRVADVGPALEALKAAGFAREDESPFIDPEPPIVPCLELVGGQATTAFLWPVDRQMDVEARYGAPVPPRVRQRWSHHLVYWTYQRWPTTPSERAAAVAILRRVDRVCALVGSTEWLAVPDSRLPFEMSSEELARVTRPVGAAHVFDL